LQVYLDPAKVKEASKAHTDAIALSEKEIAEREEYAEKILAHEAILKETNSRISTLKSIQEDIAKQQALVKADRESLTVQKNMLSEAESVFKEKTKAHAISAKSLEDEKRIFAKDRENLTKAMEELELKKKSFEAVKAKLRDIQEASV
jgi:hypothetical protein